jgi:SAM-dependent methyltransferase
MPNPRELAVFYDDAYSADHGQGPLFARWRALGAVGKADHALALCARAGVEPASTLEVGCGDGALLGELHARGFGGALHGVEISKAAAEIAAGRVGIESVELYDGVHLPGGERQHDLGIVSHVLEHVPEPAALLAEVSRVCSTVFVEVPLERNLSARRAAKSVHAAEIGHLQRLDRESMRAIVTQSNLRIAAELEDPLPLAIWAFFADGRRALAIARLKWLIRSTLHRAAPGLARRLFTVHYACLCVARDAPISVS